jgi:hypothetical protein
VARVPVAIPGVYLIHAFHCEAGVYPPLYAGKAFNLRARLLQHLESRCTTPEFLGARARFVTYFSAAPLLDPSRRDAVEAGLIRLLRPPFNRQVPRGDFICPNLPPLTLYL